MQRCPARPQRLDRSRTAQLRTLGGRGVPPYEGWKRRSDRLPDRRRDVAENRSEETVQRMERPRGSYWKACGNGPGSENRNLYSRWWEPLPNFEGFVGPAGLGLHHHRLRTEAEGRRSGYRGARCGQSEPCTGGPRRNTEAKHKRAERSRSHRAGFDDYSTRRRDDRRTKAASHSGGSAQREIRMRLVPFFLAWQICFAGGMHAQLKPVLPKQAPAANDALGSPGIDAGDYVYFSGQGPRRPDGSAPANFADQVRQCLENVKSVVDAAGLTMDHVVYVQVYLEDIKQYGTLDKVFADFFQSMPPARAVLGVARLPEPPVQITALAVRDLTGKQPVALPNLKPSKAYSAGMLTHDRLFVSTMSGSDPSTGKVPNEPAVQVDLALDRLKMVVEAAGLKIGR